MGDKAQEDYDKEHGGGSKRNKTVRMDEDGNEYDDEEEYDDEYDEDDGSDDLERGGGSAREIKDLSKTKLSNQDYVKRAQTAKAKKGKYGVTVPTPFGFDTRDKKKSMTIREQKVEEMVREKRLAEDHVVKYQFRSKPIPPEVLIPKYQSIIEADLARRQTVRSHSLRITQQREQPFSFWEREKHNLAKKKTAIEEFEKSQVPTNTFKANPIPRACSVLIFAKKMKQEELLRGKRVRKNAEISFAKAKMPPTMQKWADRKKQEPPKKLEVEYSFTPDIGVPVTAKQL